MIDEIRLDVGCLVEVALRADDLAKFPFTVKDDLRANYPFGMFAVPREKVVRVHASSGTTGKSTVVGYTAQDIDTWALLMARSGVPLSAISRAGTINNARQFGLDKDYGTVEAGKVANLLLLTENPLETMRAWTSIDRVILRGSVIKRESLAAPRE